MTATYGCRTLVVRRWCFHRGIDLSFSLEPVFHRFPVLSTAALVNLVGAPSDPAHSGFSRLERYPRSLGEVVATILPVFRVGLVGAGLERAVLGCRSDAVVMLPPDEESPSKSRTGNATAIEVSELSAP